MIKKCEQCGVMYEATNLSQRFCSNLCRQRAYRKRIRDENKESVKAHRGDDVARTIRPLASGIPAEDPRRKLIRLRTNGLMTTEYWQLYQEVDRTYYGGNGVVNGVSTNSKFFVDAVLISILGTGRIHYETKKKDEPSNEILYT